MNPRLPRLLYGLDVVHLTNTNVKVLATYHHRTLKRFQSLPLRCANVSLYILLGCLPVVAHIYCKRLIALGSIVRGESELMHDICVYQCSLRSAESKSWFVQTASLLHYYGLPSLPELIAHPPRKPRWKSMVDKAIHDYWYEYVADNACSLPTLRFLNTTDFDLRTPHVLWSSVDCNSKGLKRAQIKAQMVTGTYMTFANQSKFSQGKITPRCRLCGAEEEDIEHILLDCPALYEPRAFHLSRVKDAVICSTGVDTWNSLCLPRLEQLILDLTVLPLKVTKQDTITIETETRKFVYSVHCRRIHLLELVQPVPNPRPLPSLPPTKHSTRKNQQTSRAPQNGLALPQKRVVLPTGRKY